jgi:polyhydroxyalkanoate synthesis regulator phasin
MLSSFRFDCLRLAQTAASIEKLISSTLHFARMQPVLDPRIQALVNAVPSNHDEPHPEGRAALQQALMDVRDENSQLLREMLNLQRRINELTQELTRSQSDASILKREIEDLRRQFETASKTIQTLETEKAGLTREVALLREDRAKWNRPLAVSVRESLKTSSGEDFGRCVAGWNTVLELTARGTFVSDAIPMTCSDRWELCGWFQNVGRPDMIHYVGLECYADTEGRPASQIRDVTVNRIADTEAVLAEACQPGDLVLKVKGASVQSWHSKLRVYQSSGRNYQCVAFGPDVLPNFNVSGYIRQCQMKGDVLEVELYEGINDMRTAGTPVRMHTAGANYVYGHSGVFPNGWSEVVMSSEKHRLRPGTNSVKVIILHCNCSTSAPGYGLPAGATGSSLKIRNLRGEKLP